MSDPDRRYGWRLPRKARVVLSVLAACFVAFIAVATYLGYRDRMRGPVHTQCLNSLHQVGIAVSLYVEDHGGRYPESFDDLGGYIDNLELLLCPVRQSYAPRGDSSAVSDYDYVGVGLREGAIVDPGHTPILFDKYGNHPERARNVVMANVAVVTLKESEFRLVLLKALARETYGPEAVKCAAGSLADSLSQ